MHYRFMVELKKLSRKFSLTLCLTVCLCTTSYADTANDILAKYGYDTVTIKSDIEDKLSMLKENYSNSVRESESVESYNTLREASLLVQETQKKQLSEELDIVYSEIESIKANIENSVLTGDTAQMLSMDREYKNTIERADSILDKIDDFIVTDSIDSNIADLEKQKELIEKLETEMADSKDGSDIGTVKGVRPPFDKPVRVTSEFGTRVDPLTGVAGVFHNAMDFGLPINTTIKASFSGKVVDAGFNSGLGNYVRIDHGLGVETLYAHCNKLVAKDGDIVKQGQEIALSGNTGRSTGPHLHWGVYIDGKAVDPSILLD